MKKPLAIEACRGFLRLPMLWLNFFLTLLYHLDYKISRIGFEKFAQASYFCLWFEQKSKAIFGKNLSVAPDIILIKIWARHFRVARENRCAVRTDLWPPLRTGDHLGGRNGLAERFPFCPAGAIRRKRYF